MEVNIWFDVSAIILLAIILITYYTKYNVPIFQNKILIILVWTNFISTLMDLASGIWHNHLLIATQYIPQVLNETIQYVYFISRNLTTVCYLFYILATLGIGRRSLKQKCVFIVPILIDFVLLAVTPFTNFVFYIDNAGIYHRGSLLFVLYVVAVYYLAVSAGLIIYYGKLIPGHRKAAFIMFIVIAMVTVGIQAVNPSLLIEGFGTAICILVIYLSIQKPEETLDGDTGFLNKKTFANMLSVKMKQKSSLLVAVIVIEDFSFLEKYYGLTTTAELMKKISLYLRHFNKLIHYRISEDCICLVADSKDRGLVEQRADEILKRFEEPWIIQEYSIMVSASCGIVRCPEDAGNVEDLIELIDAALSNQAENTHLIHIQGLDVSEIKRQHQIDAIVKTAVENKLLEVVYQPIYNTKKQCFTSAEALLRLHDDDLGNISPAEFIPAAEKNGAIIKLGQFVLNSVCEFMAEYKPGQYGIEYIEVNLSTVEILQDNIVTEVIKPIQKYGLQAEQINLEITESAMDMIPENVEEKLNQLLNKGLTFSLDDYGTGYSNVSRMITLPLKIIKLDKSIVQEAFCSDAMKVVLDHTLKMVRELNKKVLAEGVETAEQAEYLCSSGCDYIQGYYYSKPLKSYDFLKFIKEH